MVYYKYFSILVYFTYFTRIGKAHVSLTFPPARRLDLDFLDNIRTKGKCGGMGKGDIKTTISNDGSKFQVSWHLGYAHGGGIKLEILDENDSTFVPLTPDWVLKNDKYATRYEVALPEGVECIGCTIRLTRQATEWGKNYQFQSCADVDIVNPDKFGASSRCLNSGISTDSSCNCGRFHFGDRCEFHQDCQDDTDCENNGICRTNPGTSLPKKECYCPIGFFGKRCEKKSEIQSKNYTESLYNVEIFSNNFKFLWREIKYNVNEYIIIAKTLSYVAVGWRSATIDPSCQMYPTDVKSPNQPKILHSMDCQDIVIGKAFGSLSNVGDYYTRDRSTPRRDEIYGGTDDLLAAAGWEEDGYTTIVFRKPVASSDRFDHDFSNTLTFIYAHGQNNGNDFYVEDELKYHGGQLGTEGVRGVTELNGNNMPTHGLSERESVVLTAGVLLFGLIFIQGIQDFYQFKASKSKDELLTLEKLE